MNHPTTTSLTNIYETTCSITALKALIFDTPEANQTKLDLIREEISTGQYRINAAHIAAKLLEYAPVITETAMS